MFSFFNFKYDTKYKKGLFLLYPLIILYMFLVFIGVPYVSIIAGLVRVLFFLLILESLKNSSPSVVRQRLKVFIIFNIISFLLFILSDIPLEAFTYDLFNFILPMFAFYIGANSKEDSFAMYEGLLVSMIICCIIGLFMYFFMPEWYSLRLIDIHNSISYYDPVGTEGDTTAYLQFTRFSSFMLTPYAIQYLGISSICVFIYKVFNVRNLSIVKSSFIFIMFVVLVFCLILCQQRATWFYLLILIPIVISVKGLRLNGKKILLIVLFSIGLVYLGAKISTNDQFNVISEQINTRGESFTLSDAMGGRENQYQNIWAHWDNPVVGSGMGSGGATARISGFTGVSDAGYMKILYENGIVGFILFLSIIIPTLIKGYKQRKIFFVEFSIMFFFILAMMGSNSLSMSLYYSIPFWLSVGRIWNKQSNN